ncbi:MAG: hypothetical protein LBP72_10460 [Dysgonamonadaceae bacterium]|jgi:hypothetical protein|nr:hypothetical protein [Dysgonamonadaceae bacterium]
MVIIQQPDGFCFSSALKDVIIQSDGNINVSFSIQGQQPFLLETYSLDSEGRIYIRELGKLFIPYISKISLRKTFVTGITGSRTGSITTLLSCRSFFSCRCLLASICRKHSATVRYP